MRAPLRRATIALVLGLSTLWGITVPVGATTQTPLPDSTSVTESVSPTPSPDTADSPSPSDPPPSESPQPTTTNESNDSDRAGAESAAPDETTEDTTPPETVDETPEEEPAEPSPEAETESPTPSEEETETREPGSEQQESRSPAPFQTGDGCYYADSDSDGAYAQTLCWLDFTGFTTEYVDVSEWWQLPRWRSVLGDEYGRIGASENVSGTRYGPIENYPVEISLAGGHTLKAYLNVEATTGLTHPARAHAVTSHAFPTWTGAFLGNGIYTGVAGEPALYQAIAGTWSATTAISLENIQLTDSNGDVLTGYSIVVADAESTDGEERIEWSTTGSGFQWLPNTPGATDRTGTMGNACRSFSPGLEQSDQNASCVDGVAGEKTGTAMLQTSPSNATAPFNVTQTMVGNGLQGVAFGVILGGANLTVEVEDRIVDTAGDPTGTNFTGTILRGSEDLATTATGDTETSASTGSQDFPIDAQGTRMTFASDVEGAMADSYAESWVCEKSTPGSTDAERWPEAGSSSVPPPADSDFARLGAGEFIDCTVTYTPPYLALVKSVDNDDTEADNQPGDWTLSAVGDESAVEVAGDSESRVAVAAGDYELTETETEPDQMWEHGYNWSDLRCSPATDLEEFQIHRDPDTEVITSADLHVAAGNDFTCTFTNTARQPELSISKHASPDSGETVNSGQEITYTLTFDNSPGTSEAEVDHVDYLRDVLDDADLVTESIEASSGLTVTPQGLDGAEPQLQITGSVPSGQVSTVTFDVVVKANAENLQERQSSDGPLVGYTLRNYLTEAEEDPPASCEEPEDGEDPLCTEHQVQSWTLTKDSRPADGAWLHVGGNIHYQISAQKMNEGTQIEDLVFTDDLTDVFNAAGWAPGAVVPGGAQTRGIYFFDDQFRSLDINGEPNGTAESPEAALDGEAGVPEPEYDQESQRWTIETDPIDVPANAMRAELWFAVEVGNIPADIPQEWPGGEPTTGTEFTNRATAKAQLPPAQCETGSASDEELAAVCQVTHQISSNYFTIRKDASGAGEDLERNNTFGTDNSGLWNMIGHEFEVRDDIDGEPSEHISEKMCRKEYDPYAGSGWDGTWMNGGTPDWGLESETLASIEQWNQENPDDSRPLCAVLYAQPDGSGGQTGRWRGENLPEGEYWLVETKAPDQQISNDGTQRRDVAGVQRLAEPVPFRVWTDDDGEAINPDDPGDPAQYGRAQLDIGESEGSYLDRCSPGSGVGDRPTACVNPTGYLMLVKDTIPAQLPFTGGTWLSWLTFAGLITLASALLAIFLWRRRQIGGDAH